MVGVWSVVRSFGRVLLLRSANYKDMTVHKQFTNIDDAVVIVASSGSGGCGEGNCRLLTAKLASHNGMQCRSNSRPGRMVKRYPRTIL